MSLPIGARQSVSRVIFNWPTEGIFAGLKKQALGGHAFGVNDDVPLRHFHFGMGQILASTPSQKWVILHWVPGVRPHYTKTSFVQEFGIICRRTILAVLLSLLLKRIPLLDLSVLLLREKFGGHIGGLGGAHRCAAWRRLSGHRYAPRLRRLLGRDKADHKGPGRTLTHFNGGGDYEDYRVCTNWGTSQHRVSAATIGSPRPKYSCSHRSALY